MAFRTFSAEHGHAGIAFCYIKDTTVGASGTWVPMTDTHLAAGGGGGGAATSTSSILPGLKINTPALSNQLLVKTGTGILFSIVGYSTANTGQYLHVYDSTSSGANLIHTQLIDPNDNFSVDFGPNGVYMNTGIFIINSTGTAGIVSQLDGANDLFITAIYR